MPATVPLVSAVTSRPLDSSITRSRVLSSVKAIRLPSGDHAASYANFASPIGGPRGGAVLGGDQQAVALPGIREPCHLLPVRRPHRRPVRPARTVGEIPRVAFLDRHHEDVAPGLEQRALAGGGG